MNDFAVPAPEIWTPDYSKLGECLRLPKWAKPWAKPKEITITLAVGIDTEMATGQREENPSTNPWSGNGVNFNNGAGDFIVYFIGLGAHSADTVNFNGNVTYGGVTMTQQATATTSGGAQGGMIGVYTLASPPTGSQALSLPFIVTGGGPNMSEIWTCPISLTGVNTTTPFKQSTVARDASGATATATATLSGVANLTLACAGGGTNFISQTQTVSSVGFNSTSSAMGSGLMTRATATGPVTHSMTMAGTDSWLIYMVEMNPAGAAVVVTNPDFSNFPRPKMRGF